MAREEQRMAVTTPASPGQFALATSRKDALDLYARDVLPNLMQWPTRYDAWAMGFVGLTVGGALVSPFFAALLGEVVVPILVLLPFSAAIGAFFVKEFRAQRPPIAIAPELLDEFEDARKALLATPRWTSTRLAERARSMRNGWVGLDLPPSREERDAFEGEFIAHLRANEETSDA